MSRRSYSREFKLSAVKLVNHQGYTVTEAAESLGVDPQNLRNWIKEVGPEVGKAPSDEPSRLREELRRTASGEQATADGGLHFKKSGGLLREEPELRFPFIRAHQEEYPVELMCDILEVSRSGFYAWLERAGESASAAAGRGAGVDPPEPPGEPVDLRQSADLPRTSGAGRESL